MMEIETLLVALDFSEAGLAGARWAIQQLTPRKVAFLHVVDSPARPRYAAALRSANDTLEAMAKEDATRRLRALANETQPRAVWEVRVGRPSEQIVSLSRELEADLIVIAPHDDRPRRWKFLGTTAERVVRNSQVPVLVATNPGSSSPRHILTPIDDASSTPAVLEWTRDLADRWDADVTLLHVWSNVLYSHVASMSYTTAPAEDAEDEIRMELSEAATRWLDEMARTGLNPTRVTAVVRYGDAGDIAVETSTAMNAGLIVMGRSGSGLIARAMLGSTVGTVLHGSRCPVLVVSEPR